MKNVALLLFAAALSMQIVSPAASGEFASAAECVIASDSLLLRRRHRGPQSELQPNQAAHLELQQQKSRESCELCHPVN